MPKSRARSPESCLPVATMGPMSDPAPGVCYTVPILCCLLLQGGSRTLVRSPKAPTVPSAIHASPGDPAGQNTPLRMLKWWHSLSIRRPLPRFEGGRKCQAQSESLCTRHLGQNISHDPLSLILIETSARLSGPSPLLSGPLAKTLARGDPFITSTGESVLMKQPEDG